MKEFFSIFINARAQAQDLGTINYPDSNFSSLEALIRGVSNWMIGIVGALAVIAIVYGGVLYLTAGGDTAKTETGRKTLIWAVTGIIIAALAYVIVNYVIIRLNTH